MNTQFLSTLFGEHFDTVLALIGGLVGGSMALAGAGLAFLGKRFLERRAALDSVLFDLLEIRYRTVVSAKLARDLSHTLEIDEHLRPQVTRWWRQLWQGVLTHDELARRVHESVCRLATVSPWLAAQLVGYQSLPAGIERIRELTSSQEAESQWTEIEPQALEDIDRDLTAALRAVAREAGRYWLWLRLPKLLAQRDKERLDQGIARARRSQERWSNVTLSRLSTMTRKKALTTLINEDLRLFIWREAPFPITCVIASSDGGLFALRLHAEPGRREVLFEIDTPNPQPPFNVLIVDGAGGGLHRVIPAAALPPDRPPRKRRRSRRRHRR